MFGKINNVKNDTLVEMNFAKAAISLQVQYHPKLHKYQPSTVFPIDPKKGIVDPFDARNITQLQ